METSDFDNMLSQDLGSDSMSSAIKLVQAKFNFKPSNNDELCFSKDDIITLTQWPSGGWWEGTLNGITGWFPSNYVQPLSSSDAELSITDNHMINSGVNNTDPDSQQYRQMVFQDIEDTESVYVRDIDETINRYLKPLQNSQVLAETEVNIILRTVQEILSVHNKFLSALKSLNSVPNKDKRIGGVFLEFAPHIKAIHLDYCSNHAKFVHSIEKSKKEVSHLFANLYPSDQSAGNVMLTSCLSASFRRLDKYPALLQELQRYTDESHIDRGDTQRAGFVYRELSMSCLELRRRKEMELEVMLGNIKNCDAFNVQSFGTIIRMDPVSIQIVPDYTEMKKDRYLVLFPQNLLVLSVSSEMTSFVFEAKLRLEDAVIKTSDELIDATNIFEMTTTSDDKTSNQTLIIQCPTVDDKKSWCELLQKHILLSQAIKCNTSSGVKSQNSDHNISQLSTFRTSNSDCSTTGSNIILNTTQQTPVSQAIRSRYWMNKCLTPHPPTRVRPPGSGDRTGSESDKHQLTANEDMVLLQAIESYCNPQRVRQSTSSGNSDGPQVFIIDDSSDKPLIDCIHSSNSFVKTNGEVVNTESELSLREEIQRMKIQIQEISDSLKAERRSRKKLKAFVVERKTSAKRQMSKQ